MVQKQQGFCFHMLLENIKQSQSKQTSLHNTHIIHAVLHINFHFSFMTIFKTHWFSKINFRYTSCQIWDLKLDKHPELWVQSVYKLLPKFGWETPCHSLILDRVCFAPEDNIMRTGAYFLLPWQKGRSQSQTEEIYVFGKLNKIMD